MSGKAYCIIPYNRRPYEWAKKEMEDNFPNPDRFWVTELDKLELDSNVHVSIFHDENSDLDIWRVYWANTDSVKYSILLNYAQLYARHPEIVRMLERNGVAAYKTEIRRQQRDRANYGKKDIYQALAPFRVILP